MQHLVASIYLDAMSNSTLLIIGFLVGYVAKNLTTIAMRTFGFAGGFMSRMAVGWWEEFRRETPNVIDFAMVAIAEYDGRNVLIMDPLIGPRRLNDVYLNPRTAFGVRMQTFSTSESKPWVCFKSDPSPSLPVRLLSRYRHWRAPSERAQLNQRDRELLRIRRTYAPIEGLVGQYLTNQWSVQMAIGEPCQIFNFVVALIYERSSDHYMDRHFHVLVIWEELLLKSTFEHVISYHPEFGHRWETIRRIANYYRSSEAARAEFGSITVMIPKRALMGAYDTEWAANAIGARVPVSRLSETPADWS